MIFYFSNSYFSNSFLFLKFNEPILVLDTYSHKQEKSTQNQSNDLKHIFYKITIDIGLLKTI